MIKGDEASSKLLLFGPMAGLAFSHGYPGGPAAGELYHARAMHGYAVDAALPAIRKAILNGNIDGARDWMTKRGVPPRLQRFYIRTSEDPGTRLSGRPLRAF